MDEINRDLKYWADKLVYADRHLWGDKKVNMERVCRMMLDLYLDKKIEFQKLFSNC